MKRRSLLAAMPALLGVPLGGAAQAAPRMQVFKNPSCSCCGAWIDHVRKAGFEATVTEVDDPSATRERLGLPEKYGSCHTAVVGGYIVEGHVPAAEIKRLLAARPAALGLAVPGMPLGSPGMEAGARQDRYAVLLVDRQGRDSVFARYPKN